MDDFGTPEQQSFMFGKIHSLNLGVCHHVNRNQEPAKIYPYEFYLHFHFNRKQMDFKISQSSIKMWSTHPFLNAQLDESGKKNLLGHQLVSW